MDLKIIFILVLLCVCMYTSDGSYIAWKTLMARRKDKPTTCSLAEIGDPALHWRIPANLSCTGDEIIDMQLGFEVTEVAAGIQCTYTYICPFDGPDTRHVSKLNCLENSQWSGDMPDCSKSDQTAHDVLSKLQNLDREQSEHPVEPENTNTEPPVTLSIYKASVKKSPSKETTNFNKLRTACHQTKMCRRVPDIKLCKSKMLLDLRLSQSTRKVYYQLCNFCHHMYCVQPRTKQSNKLI